MSSTSRATIDNIVLPVAPQDIGELVQEALNALFYTNATINAKYSLATALRQEREREGSDVWELKYELLIRWSRNDHDGVIVSIQVEEGLHNNCLNECQERAVQLKDKLISLATHALALDQQELTTCGSAKWGTANELKAADYLTDSDTPPSSTRLLLGIYRDPKTNKEWYMSVPELDTHAHALVCGPTGSGKSRSIFIPNLMVRLETSAVVTEAVSGKRKGPVLYEHTAGWREAAGHKIIYFNPAELDSVRINPLDAIVPEDPEADDPDHLLMFDAASYVSSLIMNNTKELSPVEDKIWAQSEQQLLTSLLLYAVGLRDDITKPSKEGDGANLATIRALLRLGAKGLEQVIAKSKVKVAAKEYAAFVSNTSPNFRHGVMSGLMGRLNPWVNPKIATLTEVSDFNLQDLRSKLFTVYFSTYITRPQYQAVSALALNYVVEQLLDTKVDHPVTFLFDEFVNYGYIPAIERKLTMIRNQGIGMVIGIQQTHQVKKLYKDDADVILGQPATRVFFRTHILDTARSISEQLGAGTLELREAQGRHTHMQQRPRRLKDESEVMRLPRRKILVMTQSTDPVELTSFAFDQFDHCVMPQPSLASRPISSSIYDLCRDAQLKAKFDGQGKVEIKNFQQLKRTVSRSRLSILFKGKSKRRKRDRD